MKRICDINPAVLSTVRKGTVIPAMVLALDEQRRFAPRYQRALARYFIDAGVGGIAVGVHSTQFAIRDPKINLFQRVIRETGQFIDEWCDRRGRRVLKVGGVCGRTEQALAEAEFEASCGFDAALLSMGAFKDDTVETMLNHCRQVAKVMPIIGFYLQPSVGGRALPFEFWRQFVEIPNVLAIKIAPFNRYFTLDVVRAVAESGRDDITLYTGNDDNLLLDLLTEYRVSGKSLRIKGGLLGHWSVWTKKAVELLDRVDMVTGSTRISDRVLIISGQRKLFHAALKVKIVSVISAGCTRGSTIVTNRLISPQPSISAASSSSFGTATMNCRIRKIPKAPTIGRINAA